MSEAELDEEQEPKNPEIDTFQPTFSSSIIKLNHSYGYDCKRLFNLTLIDDDTLVFASGNLIHYFSLSRREVTFRETQFGAGIGFITKNTHPDFVGLLTIAENGSKPTIFIYEYPSHNIRIKLEGAAKASFTCGSYNSTGDLFASQAGHPDFMLTIWRWQKAEVMLRSKSFGNNVLHVHFSNFNPILLCSSGFSHIKFWKMANTFTGLKLKGDLGRFGKTDFSDIYAIYMLGDENVISGCDWGNMLLWEAGLIKFEICRKGRKPCHTKPITRITMDNGEVMTVGMDGYVRIWYWETVDLADPPDDDRFVEIEPIYEFKVGSCEIRGLQKINPFDDKDFGYYAQDGDGGIWYCDLNVYDVPNEPRKLYTCHGGRVLTAQSSPVSSHIMTIGEDGRAFLYDFDNRKLLLEKTFPSVGTDLLWFNTKISKTGMELIISFQDAVIRQMFLDLKNQQAPKLHLVRAIKGHTAPITKISVNPQNTILVSTSVDKLVFVYDIKGKVNNLVNLQPIGFIQLDGIVNTINWKNDEISTVLMGGKSGEVYEYRLPTYATEEQTFLSYNLTDLNNLKATRFVSVKSRIRRDIKREATKKRKEAKRKRKLKEVEKLKAANPGLQIDMESALADSEPEEEEEPLHIPAKPNPVLWLRYTDRDTIWVSIAGYDAGYIYELQFGAQEPVRSTIIKDGDDCEIHSYLNIDEFLIFGLINGKLRINRTFPGDFTDLRDYQLVSMHDGLNGNIPKLLTSYDGKHVFSVGHDGNIFAYDWFGPLVVRDGPIEQADLPQLAVLRVEDIVSPEHPSLEQEKIYAEIRRQEEAAAAHDRKVLAQIAELQVKFNEIKSMNDELPEVLQAKHSELLLDPRITQQINDELQFALDDVREDLAYDLEVAQVGKTKLYNYFLKNLDHIPIKISAIRNDIEVASFRLECLGEEFEKIKEEIEERLRLEAAKRGHVQPAQAEEKEDSMPEPPVESFFFGRDPNSIIPRFSRKMMRLLTRYRTRQLYQIERIYNWGKLERTKPDPNKNHPDDDYNIKQAELTMGDYKLKIGSDYEPQITDNLTYKYIEIVTCREKLYNVQRNFNQKLFRLRKQKKNLYDYIEKSRKRLNVLHTFLPEKNRRYLADIPPINLDTEYPENNLKEHCTPGCGIEIKDILYCEKKVQDLLPKPPPPPPRIKKTRDEINELQQFMALQVGNVEFLPDADEVMREINSLPPLDDPAFFEKDESKMSPMLFELRYHWLMDFMAEQDGILLTVEEMISKFDESLKEMVYLRYHIKFEAEFMCCYMISLNQELNILRDSEEIENQLLYNADEAMKTRNEMQVLINGANRQTDECRKAVEKLNDQIAGVQFRFMTVTKGHKFFDFLRRIFKKKFKPPKPPKTDDESSESSSSDESSSEDEEDTKSIDSTDMTTIRLDETHCPTGLDRAMYEMAFTMRSERHALEKAVIDTQKTIEEKRREINELQKKMKYHEDVYAQERETLLVFRRKRQQELNKVKVSVVLSMSQMQHFYGGDDYHDLSRAVLFDANRLSSLRDRVSRLNDEAIETRRLHRINIVHLRRMNTDIKFMRHEITRLEEDIKEEMMKKFGLVVDLDELEEEVLRKYVFELETTAEEELRLIEKEMRAKKRELANLQDELIRETQYNNEKLNILTVLHEEKNFLDDLLDVQEKNYEKWLHPNVVNFERDVEKLTAIDKQQKEQIECLEREICTLRLKAKPLQLYHEAAEESLPKTKAAPDICPEELAPEAFLSRVEPNSFQMERVKKIVQKSFANWFGAYMSTDNVRKYAKNVARYLAQAAITFEGKITDRILECVTESLQAMIPKKYLIYMKPINLETLLKEVLLVFDYETSDVNTEELLSGIFANAMETLTGTEEILNKTQFVMLNLFKELIEVLPLEEFVSEKTLRTLVDIMAEESVIDPRCINIEDIVESVTQYAKENLLDSITSVPIRRLAEGILKDLQRRKPNTLSVKCSSGSMSHASTIKF